MITLIEKTTAEHTAWMQARPYWVGPSSIDRLEAVLLASSFVNQKARRLAAQDVPGLGPETET